MYGEGDTSQKDNLAPTRRVFDVSRREVDSEIMQLRAKLQSALRRVVELERRLGAVRDNRSLRRERIQLGLDISVAGERGVSASVSIHDGPSCLDCRDSSRRLQVSYILRLSVYGYFRDLIGQTVATEFGKCPCIMSSLPSRRPSKIGMRAHSALCAKENVYFDQISFPHTHTHCPFCYCKGEAVRVRCC
jgi:hypothetical protein